MTSKKISLLVASTLLLVIGVGFAVLRPNTVHADGPPLAVGGGQPNGMAGKGLPSDPYIIATCDDLQNISLNLEKFFYVLGNDISCGTTTSWNNGNGFKPIETFSGHLDGRGHTIHDLYINCQVEQDLYVSVTVFKYLSSGASITNLKLNNATYDVTTCPEFSTAAGLVGDIYHAEVTDVSFDGDILTPCSQNTYGQQVGGLVGQLGAGGRIIRSSATGGIIQTGTSCSYTSSLGGLVGSYLSHEEASIYDSFADVDITLDTEIGTSCFSGASCQNIGGLVGFMGGDLSGKIYRSYSAGSINITSPLAMNLSYSVGGIIGYRDYHDVTVASMQDVFTATSISVPGPCDNMTCGNNVRAVGAVVGSHRIGDSGSDNYSSVYYDQTSVGISDCDDSPGDDSPDCTAINTDGNDGGYFKNSAINPPLDTWNFSKIWQTASGLPTLQAPSDQYPDPAENLYSTILSPNSVRINWNPPSNGGSDPLTDKSFVEVKVDDATHWTGFEEADSGVTTINGLPPSTPITIRISLINEGGYISPYSEITTTTATPGFKLISDCDELQDIQNDLSANYELSNDIDCNATQTWNNGQGFVPIGECEFGPNVFTGILDGNGHSINGLYINTDNETCSTTGIFGTAGQSLIQDLTVSDITFTNQIANGSSSHTATVGGVIGLDIGSTIKNVHLVNAHLSGAGYVGGFIAQEYGVYGQYDMEFSNNSFSGSITGISTSDEAFYGGLVAFAYSIPGKTLSVTNNYVDADISVSSNASDVGSIVGGAFGLFFSYLGPVEIENTYASGTITVDLPGANQSRLVGGYVGAATSISENSFNIKNSFSNTLINTTAAPDSSVSGFGLSTSQLGGYVGNYINNYFDADLAGTTDCSYPQEVSCTAISDDSTYFFNNSVNSPLDVWDFTNIWETTSTLPIFKASLVDTPTEISTERINRNNVTTAPGQGGTAGQNQGSGQGSPQNTGLGTPSFIINGSGSSKEVQPLEANLFEKFAESLRNFVRELPEGAVRSFPYILFGLILAAVLLMLFETRRQTMRLKTLRALITKQRSVAQQRDTFWHIAANYLRAPVTLLMGGAELLELQKEQPASHTRIISLVKGLQSKVSSIMESIEKSSTLKGIEWPSSSVSRSVASSPSFWIPLAFVAGLIALANYIAVGFRQFTVSTLALLTQVMIFVIVAYVLYWAMTVLTRARSQVEKAESMLDRQTKALSEARSYLVNQSLDSLDVDVANLQKTVHQTSLANSSKLPLSEGAERLHNIISSFELLNAAETGHLDNLTAGSNKTDLSHLLGEVIQQEHEHVIDKNLTIDSPELGNLQISGNPRLNQQVIGAVLDNAVAFSPANGQINIELLSKPGMQGLTIRDHGPGVSHDQLSHMFEPFTKADGYDALKIDHEGLGIDLYLNKLIMEHLGGEISATSTLGKGTTVSMWWPASK